MMLVAAFLLSAALGQPTSDLYRRIAQDVNAHQKQIVDELLQLLSIPNVASDKGNIRRNAQLLQQMFAKRGLAAEVLETEGNPLVFAAQTTPKPGVPTIL